MAEACDLLFGAKVLAAHCVHVDDGEMRALKNFGAGVAHNPTSSLKLGAGVAPVARMLELDVDGHLERHLAIELRVVGDEHFAHAAGAEWGHDGVVPQ